MQLFQFKDLVGNASVLTPLKNLLSKNRLPNFNIFGGEFGMGKTTAAIITAMRITCDTPNGYEPCLECEVCKNNMKSLTSSGKNMYVNKINMGYIETTKQMEDLANSMFSQRGYAGKIAYILEEFQGLSEKLQEKLLEQLDRQDPSIYIFVTCTDLHKVLETIKSRTVPFVFTRFNDEESKILTLRECNRLGMSKPSVGFVDLIVRSSKGVARNVSKIVQFAKSAELDEDTLRDFLGEVPTPVYTLLLDLMIKDESLALEHLESTLIKYSVSQFLLGYKAFVERLIYLRRTETSAYFTDDEAEMLKSYKEDAITKVHRHSLRLSNNFDTTDVRLHFISLVESLRGKTVIEANSDKVSQQVRNAAQANIESRSMEFNVIGETKVNSFDEEVTIESLRRMKK